MANDIHQDELRHRLRTCYKILQDYSWLLDSYILDFFVEDHARNLPTSLTSILREIPLKELGYLLDVESNRCNYIWPLSLIVLRFLVKHLGLPRKPREGTALFPDTRKELATEANGQGFMPDALVKQNYTTYTLFSDEKLKKLFLKHIKSKKWYEVLKISKITAMVAQSLDISHVVDVGSGLGHLSRISGYGFGLNLLSIESEAALSEEAKKLDRELEIRAGKLLSKPEMESIKSRRPVHITKTISCELDLGDFLKLVKGSFCKDNNLRFGIVGLHPCGNLAVKLLTSFVNCQEMKFITLVCCCYHKITISGGLTECPNINCGLISNFCRKKNMIISPEARGLACHALETYSERLQKGDFDHLKIHCYRATLEHIINKNWPHLRKSQLSNVKHGPKLSFRFYFHVSPFQTRILVKVAHSRNSRSIKPIAKQLMEGQHHENKYCEKALKKIPVSIPEEDYDSETTLEYLSKWKNVVIYYSLRLLLAPLVETVILIDRMLFLLENGCECRLEAVFEPQKSPRNFVLVGKKRE